MLHFKASLHLHPRAKPVFFRPRSIPFAIKEAVEKELEHLEAEGIIEKVDSSEWAAPIVPISKGDGHLCICGDYRITVNPSGRPTPTTKARRVILIIVRWPKVQQNRFITHLPTNSTGGRVT